MFICQVSGRVSKPGEKSFKVVVETRPKVYFEKDKKTGALKKVGEGTEIVKEVTVCEDVYKKMTQGETNV